MIRRFSPPGQDTPYGPALKTISAILDFECLEDLKILKENFYKFKKCHKRTHKGQKNRKLDSNDRLYIYSLVKIEKVAKKEVAAYFCINLRSVNRIIEQLTARPETALQKACTPLKKDIITQRDLTGNYNLKLENKIQRNSSNFRSKEKIGSS
jgi:hypothetical protein